MKKLITTLLCFYACMLTAAAQQYYCQPYYGQNKIRFYNTDNPVGSAPFYTLDLSADVNAAWGVNTPGVNAVAIYKNKIFVSFDLGNKGGVLIYNYADVYPTRNATPPVVVKPQTTNGLSSAGIAVNPANGDLYIPTFNNGTDDSGVYLFKAAANYATGSQFSSFFNDGSVAEICANLAFDRQGNLWMTTWTPNNNAAEHFLMCYKGASKANYYKIKNTPTPTYTAKDVNNVSKTGLNLLSAPEGIAFDPGGNLWLGNNNDDALTNGAGQGTLVKIDAGWINSLLAGASTGLGAGNPEYTVPAASADIKYIQNGKLGGITFSAGNIYINDQGQNQGIDFTTNGTVWKWDVTSAFNSTNFKASGIHTTYPGNGGAAVMTTLFMADDNNDNGAEPNTTAAIAWESNDIWVRQGNDGLSNLHITEEVLGGQPCHVYIMVHNAGMFPGKGTEQLKLYWAKGGTALSWEYPWTSGAPNNPKLGDLIGTQTVTVVQQGNNVVLDFPWTAPDPANYTSMFPSESGHFCLLARLVTSNTTPFGMTTPETADIIHNALFNNKIVWKNIGISSSQALVHAGIIAGNYTKGSMRARLSFELLNADGQHMGLNGGKLVFVAKGIYLEKLKRDTLNRRFLKDIGNNQFEITNLDKGIDNLVLAPGEILPLSITFTPAAKMEGYVLRVIQYAYEGSRLKQIGGQTFVTGKVKGFMTQPAAQHATCYWWWVIAIILLILILLFIYRKKK